MTASDDNRIVQGLWVGGRLSPLERLCIRSYCAQGHEFHLYHYDELQNVPCVGGLRIMGAAEILPRTAVFRHRKFSFAYFADRFRFELLRKRGGWWVDMDTVCVRPLGFASDVMFCGDPANNFLWNGILKFPRGHFLAAAMAEACADVNRIQRWDGGKTIFHKLRRRLLFWRDSRQYITARDAGGMTSFMSAVRHFGMEKYALPPQVFFWQEDRPGHKLFGSAGCDWNGLLSRAPELRCLHFSGTHIHNNGTDKDGEFPPDSLYEILKRRYGEAEE